MARREIPVHNIEWYQDYLNRVDRVAMTSADHPEVREAMMKLSPREVEVVYYLVFDQVSQAEAARQMGVHRSTVQHYWETGKAKLERELQADVGE